MAAPAAPEGPDPTRFREAMARLAAGVAIVACRDDGKPRGLLVSSLTSLSVTPPRVLFCVAKSAGSHDPLARADRCALSVLSDRDTEEAECFSSGERGAERFTSAAWRLAPGAPPLHRGALIGLTGPISQRVDAGSHSVFILDVETVESQNAGPLIYFDRAFRSLGVSRARTGASA
jgi:flavin reductase